MIIVKIINQRVVQVAFTQTYCATPNLLVKSIHNQHQVRKIASVITRNLTQSSRRNQRVTVANNQQLIPFARNITFRQTHKIDEYQLGVVPTFNITHADSSSPFISASDLDSGIFVEEQHQPRESTLEALKRKARDVVEKRELTSRGKYYGQIFNETLALGQERRLVVLLSWLEAKEKHIEKYRQFYLDRGFDVLNVKTSPLDLLLPGRGTLKISRDFVRFMKEKDYSDVVIHGFSVGGYMFGEFLVQIDQQEPEVREKLLNSVRGLIFDSLMPIEGVCVGVANSLSSNPIVAKIVEQMLRAYLVLGHSFATKYYERVSEKVWGGPLKCPSMFMMSKDDHISDHRIVQRLSKTWSGLGIECHERLFENSPHVQLFNKHNKAYVESVEYFLKRIKLDPIN